MPGLGHFWGCDEGEWKRSSRKSWGTRAPIFGITHINELTAGPGCHSALWPPQGPPHSLTQGSDPWGPSHCLTQLVLRGFLILLLQGWQCRGSEGEWISWTGILTSCVTLGKTIDLSVPIFSIHETETIVLLSPRSAISLEVVMCSWCVTHSQCRWTIAVNVDSKNSAVELRSSLSTASPHWGIRHSSLHEARFTHPGTFMWPSQILSIFLL